jgi:hypothetical protein
MRRDVLRYIKKPAGVKEGFTVGKMVELPYETKKGWTSNYKFTEGVRYT